MYCLSSSFSPWLKKHQICKLSFQIFQLMSFKGMLRRISLTNNVEDHTKVIQLCFAEVCWGVGLIICAWECNRSETIELNHRCSLVMALMSHWLAVPLSPKVSVHVWFQCRNVKYLEAKALILTPVYSFAYVQLTPNQLEDSIVIVLEKSRPQEFAFCSLLHFIESWTLPLAAQYNHMWLRRQEINMEVGGEKERDDR